MMRQLAGVAMLAVAIGCFGQAPKAEEYAAVSAKVSLADGSQLVGVPRFTTLPLVTAFGKQDIPLAHISTLDVTPGGVTVKFANRDVLSGKLEHTGFMLKTIFSDVRLEFAQVKTIQFSKQGGGKPGMNEPGLLLHARLDAETEDLGAFDARMNTTNVRVVEGRDGHALLFEAPDARGFIDVPFSPFLMSEGTVEFWAKIQNPHQQFITGSGQPWFFNIECPEIKWTRHLVFGFSNNDGGGGGGLMGIFHGIAMTATHRWGTTQTVAETRLLGTTPDGWHHYTFAWKRGDGFEFPEVKGKALLFALDGKVVASIPDMTPVPQREAEQNPHAKVRIIINDNSPSNRTYPFAIADLKVWDHAKLPEKQ